MKRVYLGNKELTTIATRDSAGGGGGDDTQKWVGYFNGTLTEFTVPEGVTNVNPSTFVSCTGLTSLTLPSSVTSIGSDDEHGMMRENPFDNLQTMTVKATTPPTILGYGEIIPDTIETIYVPAASVDSYKSANKWSNYDDKIQAIAQNETVVIYNDGTSKEFDIKGELTKDNIENITAATKVYIGNSVTSIGDTVFWGNSSITTIVIPSSVKTIGIAAFRETNITSIIIPDGTTKIEDSMCWMCSKLKSAIIPASVTSIEPQPFRECPNLTSVTIKNSTNKLTYSRQAFEGISSNAKLYVPSNLLSDYQADSNWTGAFKGGIYAIGTSMIVTYLDGSTKEFTGLTSIEEKTDSNKTNAKSVEIFNGVKEIGSNAFYQCSSLTDITIPDSVKKIDSNAFYQCSSLTDITIPDSVKKIDMSAFNSCSNLNSITIPNSVKELGGYVFQDCTSLTSIDIGSSLSRLEDRVFTRCSRLGTVIIRNSTTKVTFNSSTYSKTFEGTPSSKKLYVPSNLLADYQADSNWTNEFKGGIYAIGSSSGGSTHGV